MIVGFLYSLVFSHIYILFGFVDSRKQKGKETVTYFAYMLSLTLIAPDYFQTMGNRLLIALLRSRSEDDSLRNIYRQIRCLSNHRWELEFILDLDIGDVNTAS